MMKGGGLFSDVVVVEEKEKAANWHSPSPSPSPTNSPPLLMSEVQHAMVDVWQTSMKELAADKLKLKLKTNLATEDRRNSSVKIGERGGVNSTIVSGKDLLRRLKIQRHRNHTALDDEEEDDEMDYLDPNDDDLRLEVLDQKRLDIKSKLRAIEVSKRSNRNRPDPKSLQALYSGLNLYKTRAHNANVSESAKFESSFKQSLSKKDQSPHYSVVKEEEEDHDDLIGEEELLSDHQIELAIRYIKSCCRDESTKSEITLDELEAAFKKHRFSVQNKSNESYCRGLMGKLEHILIKGKLTPEAWFRLSDSRGGLGGDGKVSHLELVESIMKLCSKLDLPSWSKHDILLLLRYMDPSSDSDLTLAEVYIAFRRYQAPPEYENVLKSATPIVCRLEDFMSRKQIRVKDLFRSIDTDDSNAVSFSELKKALQRMFGQGRVEVKGRKEGHPMRKSTGSMNVKSANSNSNSNSNNNISKRMLKEAKENRLKAIQDFNIKIFEEARNLQREIVICINEANIYSELLCKSLRYRLVSRDENEDERWRRLIENSNLAVAGELPRGTSERIEKTLVEAYSLETGESKINIFTSGDFVREHAKLRADVKKQKSIATTTFEAKLKKENTIDKNSNQDDAFVDGVSNNLESLVDLAQFREQHEGAQLSESERLLLDLKGHIQGLLEDAIRRSTAMERQVEAIHQAGWNLL